MALKRPLSESTDTRATKKARKGFSVGPQNLPDGTYKRKVDKIRRKLVENAKIRKSYDKLKAKEQDSAGTSNNDLENVTEQQQQPASIIRHPERQALIDGEDANEKEQEDVPSQTTGRRPRKHKQPLFQGDLKIAEGKRKEANKRREDIEAARKERDKRLAERERWRRTMANARGDGKRRKLGKESTVLLEKVKRMLENEIRAA